MALHAAIQTPSSHWDETVAFPQPWFRRSNNARRVPRASSKAAQVESLVAQYWPAFSPVHEIFELGDGEERHFIFRSHGGGRFLLRRFTGWSDEAELKVLLSIQHALADGIFSEPYAGGLRSIRTHTDDLMIKTDAFSDRGAWWYALNRFVEGVTHYEGGRLEELHSTATMFGKVIELLQHHTPALRTMDKKLVGISPFNEWFGGLERDISLDTSTSASTWKLLLHAHAPLVTRCMEEVRSLGEPVTWSCIPALFDFEPNNCFMAAHQCVLIFDFEHIQLRWPEQAVVAFALHRFCREYVSRELPRQLGAFAPIRESVTAFINGYAASRASFKMPLHDLHLWVKLTNLYKLFRWVSYSLDARKDPRWRSASIHREEVLRLLSYLKEADIIRDALNPKYGYVEVSMSGPELPAADVDMLRRVVAWMGEQTEMQHIQLDHVANLVAAVFRCTSQRSRAYTEVGVVRMACVGGLIAGILPADMLDRGASKRLEQVHEVLTERPDLLAILECRLPTPDSFRRQLQRALRTNRGVYGPLIRRDVYARVVVEDQLKFHVPGSGDS